MSCRDRPTFQFLNASLVIIDAIADLLRAVFEGTLEIMEKVFVQDRMHHYRESEPLKAPPPRRIRLSGK